MAKRKNRENTYANNPLLERLQQAGTKTNRSETKHVAGASSSSSLLWKRALVHVQVLASDGVEQHALAAIGLDLLDSRGREGVRLDSQALGRQLDRLAVLVVAADHLDLHPTSCHQERRRQAGRQAGRQADRQTHGLTEARERRRESARERETERERHTHTAGARHHLLAAQDGRALLDVKLVHVASLQARLVRHLGVVGTLVEHRQVQEAVVGLLVPVILIINYY